MPRRATGVLAHDAAIAEVVQAEDRVLAWFRTHQYEIEDCRKQHRGYDFRVRSRSDRPWIKVDVKADFHAEETRRLAFETVIVDARGFKKPGWGQLGIDWVIFVLPSDEGEWVAYFCRVRQWRILIEDKYDQSGTGWLRFNMPNPKTGNKGQGWAVPIEQLKAAEIIFKEEFV
jgi:hypothetical protein